MKFWAIAYQYQEDVFYNLETGEDTLYFTEQCFLPCKSLAQQVIEDELNINYVPVEIELQTLKENGTWSWSRGKVERWDRE